VLQAYLYTGVEPKKAQREREQMRVMRHKRKSFFFVVFFCSLKWKKNTKTNGIEGEKREYIKQNKM
jgi:hypothetical protein